MIEKENFDLYIERLCEDMPLGCLDLELASVEELDEFCVYIRQHTKDYTQHKALESFRFHIESTLRIADLDQSKPLMTANTWFIRELGIIASLDFGWVPSTREDQLTLYLNTIFDSYSRPEFSFEEFVLQESDVPRCAHSIAHWEAAKSYQSSVYADTEEEDLGFVLKQMLANGSAITRAAFQEAIKEISPARKLNIMSACSDDEILDLLTRKEALNFIEEGSASGELLNIVGLLKRFLSEGYDAHLGRVYEIALRGRDLEPVSELYEQFESAGWKPSSNHVEALLLIGRRDWSALERIAHGVTDTLIKQTSACRSISPHYGNHFDVYSNLARILSSVGVRSTYSCSGCGSNSPIDVGVGDYCPRCKHQWTGMENRFN